MASTPRVVVIGGRFDGNRRRPRPRDAWSRRDARRTGKPHHGTTGRMHGLLHSGGRYAVSDQKSARECIEENRVLRDIASHCVEMTGGLFVKRPEDTEEYFEQKLRGCPRGKRGPRTGSPDVEKAIAVPDGASTRFAWSSRTPGVRWNTAPASRPTRKPSPPRRGRRRRRRRRTRREVRRARPRRPVR